MKRAELEKYIEDHHLLDGVENKPAIYAITIDGDIVYVGQSKWAVSRLSDHIYYTQNATFIDNDRKYKLLLSAKLGGHKVRYKVLEYCKEEDLKKLEDIYITSLQPMLNALTPYGFQNIDLLKIEDLINKNKPNGYLTPFAQTNNGGNIQ